MEKPVFIRLFDQLVLLKDGVPVREDIAKSPKSAAILAYLILESGNSVPVYKLYSIFWNDEDGRNPEGALKTMISRLRAALNRIEDGLGACIVSCRGGYSWQSGEKADCDTEKIQTLLDLFGDTEADPDRCRAAAEEILTLYTGDLLQHMPYCEWAASESARFKTRYIAAMRHYAGMLFENGEIDRAAEVCCAALTHDAYDDDLNIRYMMILLAQHKTAEALVHYRQTVSASYHYLGVRPSRRLEEFYKYIVSGGRGSEITLQSVRNELNADTGDSGAFVCEYAVFREIYTMQMKNAGRMNIKMSLAILSVQLEEDSVMNAEKMSDAMNELLLVLRSNLRKGDAVARFSRNTYVLLLPAADENGAAVVMGRISSAFFRACPQSTARLNVLAGPLTELTGGEKND